MGRSALPISTWRSNRVVMRTASPPAPKLLLFDLMREPSLSYFRHGSLFLLNPFFFPCFSFIFVRSFVFYSLSFSTGRDSWGENKSRRHERINRPTTRKQQTGHKPPTETNGQMLCKKTKKQRNVNQDIPPNFFRVSFFSQPTHAPTQMSDIVNFAVRIAC